MFSTPLICCSSGVTTVAATTSALAPGYCPVTLMTGGAISGYWAIGNRPNDTSPKITNKTKRNAAKIGRSIKDQEMRMGMRALVGHGLQAAAGGRVAGLRHFLWGNLGAGAGAHQAVDDDAIIRVEAARDDAQALDHRTQGDKFRPGHVVIINNEYELADLLGADGHIRQQHRLACRSTRNLDAPEHARGQRAIGVGKLGAATDGAGGTIDDVVDEIRLARVREIGLVDEFELDGHAGAAIASRLAGKTHRAQIGRLIHGELEA